MSEVTSSIPGVKPGNYSSEREDRRKGRLQLVCKQKTPEEFVAAWDFFRNYYLMHEQAYFYDGLVDTSPNHYEWAYFRAKFRRNAIGAHRGSAKSTIITREFPLMNLLTRPGSKTVVVNMTMEKVESNFTALQEQLKFNPRIRDDFGNMVPKKGDGVWNKHLMWLQNRAICKGFGITSDAMRGERPHLIVVDDPEYDAKGGTNMRRVVGDMEVILFKVILPMLRLKMMTQLFWIGTPVDKRLFLWKLLKGEDPRLVPELWNRKEYPIKSADGKVFWPAEYDDETIRIRQLESGEYFGSEYMLSPGDAEDCPLKISPQNNEYHLADQAQEPQYGSPFENICEVKWHDSVPRPDGTLEAVPRTERYDHFVGGLKRAITVDYAPTTKPSSDFSVIHVLGMDKLNLLWSLDLDVCKVASEELIRKIWKMALNWQVRLVGVEAVSIQGEFAERVRSEGEMLKLTTGYVPQMIEIRHPSRVSKEDRISSLAWRFRKGLIKYPSWREHDKNYSHLYHQTRDFVIEGTGLEHDDAIDSLAMYTHVLKGGPPSRSDAQPRSPSQLLSQGELEIDKGIPTVLGVDFSKVPIEVVKNIMSKAHFPEGSESPAPWENASL